MTPFVDSQYYFPVSGILVRKSLPVLMTSRVVPILSSSVLSLFLHFDLWSILILAAGETHGSDSIFCRWMSDFPNTMIKRLSFLQSMFLVLQSKVKQLECT